MKDWRQLVAKTAVNGTEWGIADVKDTIVEVCKANESFMRQLAKFGKKSSVALGKVPGEVLHYEDLPGSRDFPQMSPTCISCTIIM